MYDLRANRWLLSVVILTILILFLGFFYLHTNGQKNTSLLEPPLKNLAQSRGIDLGNFAIRNRIQEQEYHTILSSQFNVALADNTPNWYFTDGGLRPSENTYYFDHMDEVVGYAQTNNMFIQAHHYVWGEEKWLPEWLINGNYSKDQLFAIMQDHIKTVGSRYAGRIQEWTVVNESFSRGQHINDLRDWWGDATGSKDYIDLAFIAAREADPYSKLLLNDFGNEIVNSVSDEMYTYVKDAKQRGIPIDGLGMQMHIDGANPPKKEDVIYNMKRFKDIGVDVYVTEFDVTMHGVKGTNASRENDQAKIYYDMIRACIESNACVSFSFLGITDKETWYSYMGVDDAMPLPFDKEYNPKAAYYAIHKALQ